VEPLRIAMFSDSALPVLNGVSISVNALVRELRDRGHSVHVYAPNVPGHRDEDPNTFRCRAIKTPWASDYPLAIPPFYRLLRRFRQHQYDLVHTHTPFALGMVGLRWAESHDLPIVATYHTLYDRYAHYLAAFPRRYARFRIAKHTNFYFNRMDAVITPSEAAQKWLRRHSVNRPITVVPTGAPRRAFLDRAECRGDLGLPPDLRVMLYVGRLAREKNLNVLFEMAARCFAADPSLRLWLVGDGPYRNECKELARHLGIGDRVRFVGFVPRVEVDRYYAAADIFVFPSITETQGLVVQEAMSYGLPAVAIVGGGASSGIEHGLNGLVVRNDADEFARATLRVLSEESLHASMSAAAARSVRAHGLDEMTEGVLDVYRSAINTRSQEARPDRFAWI
jgi:glycosyltransferase involved in cell wall biosynthesis